MSRRLKIVLAVAALQLVAALPAAGRDGVGAASGAPRVAAAERRRAPMSRRGVPRGRRKRVADPLLPGVWGGEHIRFEVTERGANIEYDCARETVEGRILVDAQGRFSAEGTHYEEHGGPVRADEDAGGYRVRLSGRVGGSLMKLTVTRADTKRRVGTYSLARDREANLVKCR